MEWQLLDLNGFDCEMASGATVVGIKKLISEEIIKKDDIVVGILTGRQKDAMIPVDYHIIIVKIYLQHLQKINLLIFRLN